MCSEDCRQGDGVVIDVRDVSKAYRVYARPMDRFKQAFAWGRKQYYREFMALSDVSLQVRRGEMVGIIGRNGSGKSTLLQIIAGTLAATAGEVTVRGRVAALLELGSGFDPEATGTENVFMNGALLGLAREQIQAQYDEIVAFADIGDFVDQPVKTYSSGMMVRLAFAVAAHVLADILIIDEALAVGDEGFQRKCYGWLERFQAAGGTVLFVTHGTQTVVALCERAFLLDEGRVLAHGSSKPVTDVYQKLLYGSAEDSRCLRRELARVGGLADELRLAEAGDTGSSAEQEPAGEGADEAAELVEAYYDAGLIRPPETTYGSGEAEIYDVALYDGRQRAANILVAGRPCELRYRVRFDASVQGVRFGMMIKTVAGVDVVGVSSGHLGKGLPQAEAGQIVEVAFRLGLNVAPGVYFLNCGVSAVKEAGEVFLHRRVDVMAMRVVAGDVRDIYGLAFTDPDMSLRVVKAGERLYV